MKIALIVIAFILAIIGWFKRDVVPPYVTAIVVLLLLVFAVFQIVIEIKEEREKDKTKYAGVLKPETKLLLSGEKNIYPKLELGDGGTIFAWEGPEGQPMFRFFKDNHITIVIEDGQLKVSALIRNKHGIVAELLKNEWKVNLNNSFDRNFSKNALEVKDNTGEIVFQVKHVSDRIQFQGKFYDTNGKGIALIKSPDGKGGLMVHLGPNVPDKDSIIEPLFKYPSDLHIGEMNK